MLNQHFTEEELYALASQDVHDFILQGNFQYAIKFIIYVREEFLERCRINETKGVHINENK